MYFILIDGEIMEFSCKFLCYKLTGSGYIIFNVAMIFVISWLFFGGYKKFIPTKAVEKVRDAKSSKSAKSEDAGEKSAGTDYATRTDDQAERQYIEEGQTQAG
jgi:hypothetical protein